VAEHALSLHRVIVLTCLLVACAPVSPASATPTPTLTSSPAASTAARASPTPSTALPTATREAATVEGAIDELASALERSDWNALAAAIGPEGWNAGFYAGGGTNDMPATAAMSWLRARAENDRLTVSVDRRGQTTSDGRTVLTSRWRDFNAYMTTPNRTPVQTVQLVLSRQGERWYWRTGSFGGPA
jgi:hypothetical protein